MDNESFKIVPYESAHKEAFIALNKAWIEKYFKLESVDLEIFENLEIRILGQGGFIFCALADGKVVGVCAAVKLDDQKYGYEFSKLSVDERYRGRGIGEALFRACIAKAQSLSDKKIFLESNTKLKSAIALYRKFGFREVPIEKPLFDRVDIQMEL